MASAEANVSLVIQFMAVVSPEYLVSLFRRPAVTADTLPVTAGVINQGVEIIVQETGDGFTRRAVGKRYLFGGFTATLWSAKDPVVAGLVGRQAPGSFPQCFNFLWSI